MSGDINITDFDAVERYLRTTERDLLEKEHSFVIPSEKSYSLEQSTANIHKIAHFVLIRGLTPPPILSKVPLQKLQSIDANEITAQLTPKNSEEVAKRLVRAYLATNNQETRTELKNLYNEIFIRLRPVLIAEKLAKAAEDAMIKSDTKTCAEATQLINQLCQNKPLNKQHDDEIARILTTYPETEKGAPKTAATAKQKISEKEVTVRMARALQRARKVLPRPVSPQIVSRTPPRSPPRTPPLTPRTSPITVPNAAENTTLKEDPLDLQLASLAENLAKAAEKGKDRQEISRIVALISQLDSILNSLPANEKKAALDKQLHEIDAILKKPSEEPQSPPKASEKSAKIRLLRAFQSATRAAKKALPQT